MPKAIGTKKKNNPSKLNAVRNPDGIWINTSVFREEGIRFMKSGFYTPDPWGSPGWQDYWVEQLRRCREGYTVGGCHITGHHYGYMNFAPIQKLDTNSIRSSSKNAKKITGFPDFWDGDYNFFHCMDIARNGLGVGGSIAEQTAKMKGLGLAVNINPIHLNGGWHMLAGKARRKGYSFKNAWVCANNYNTIPSSLSMIGAYDKAYLYGKGKGTMVMASNYLNFLNDSTGWRKSRDFVDKQENRRASYKKMVDGVAVEAGYMSEIIALTFKDNPDAARGKDPYIAILEELGAWPGFLDALAAIAPGLTAGKYITGQIIGFGTGGDMAGGTEDFAYAFYNAALYGFMPFENIWDENSEGTECGFFHPMQWNREGYYDEQGNSNTKRALEDEQIARQEILKKSSGTGVLEGRMQEHPTCPAEAFLTVSTNDFPIVELRNRLNKVKRDDIHIKTGQPVTLFRDEAGRVRAKPDLKGELNPIWFQKAKTEDKTGAVVIYEYPIENAPRGLYKVGYDPYRQDKGTSLGTIFVYKGFYRGDFSRDMIVAEYTGRPKDADDMNKSFEMLIELYNTQGMYENEVTHVKSYFQRRHKLYLLAAQPDKVISNAINDSKVDRIYGCHMVDKLKDQGEKYVKSWLLRVRDIDGEGNHKTTIDYINSPGLLEELIYYNRKGNFDRVMALMQVMIQMEEEELDKEYSEKDIASSALSSLAEMMGDLYKRNS